jgi:colanic acid/amylovoran biosynthesis glycosyltransferase
LCLAVSSYIADRAVACGADPDRVQVHHMGIPTVVEHPGPGVRPSADRFKIAHVARLVEKKGTQYLLDAVRLLRSKGLPVELVIVGDGPLRASLEQMVTAWGIGDAVSFRGELDHRAAVEVIAGADVLAVPSVPARNGDTEGLGMVMLEAAARSVPVVATASGGIVDFLVDDVTGFLARPRDSAALAAALERCLTDTGKAAAITARARATLRSEFDVNTQTERLEELFDAMIEQFHADAAVAAGRRG